MPVRERVQQRRFASTAAEALVSLVVAADHFTTEAGDLCGRHGITGDQYNVLRILRGAEPHGLARKEINARLMRRAPDVTRLLDRLEVQGLVARRPGEEDRRLSIARITPEGRRLLGRIDPEMDALMAEIVAPLGAAEQRELARLCDRIVP